MFNLNFLTGINVGDDSKPILIAICLIVSVAVTVALFILNHNSKDDEE